MVFFEPSSEPPDSLIQGLDTWMLRLHGPNCTNEHSRVFADETVDLWKALIFMLEDEKPEQWSVLIDALLLVPEHAQKEFVENALLGVRGRIGGAVKRVADVAVSSIATRAIVFEGLNGETHLLLGQFYRNKSSESLFNWAIGAYGIEYEAQYSKCIVISVDINHLDKTNVTLLSRETFWPEPEDVDEAIAVSRQGSSPINSMNARDVVGLYMKDRGSTREILLNLAEQSDSVACELLKLAGFNSEVVESLDLDEFEGGVDKWYVFQYAQQLANVTCANQTDVDFILLSLLLNTRASEILSLLEIDSELLQRQVIQSICERYYGQFFRRFSKCAVRAILFGQIAAREQGQGYFGSGHLLLGLARKHHDGKVAKAFQDIGQSLSSKAFEEAAVNYQTVDEILGELNLAPMHIPIELPFTRFCQNIFLDAQKIADEANSTIVNTTHLSLALLAANHCKAHSVLERLKVRVEVLRESILKEAVEI